MLTNPLRYDDVVGQRSEEQQNIVVGVVLQCNGSYLSLGCYPFPFRRGVYCSAECKFFIIASVSACSFLNSVRAEYRSGWCLATTKRKRLCQPWYRKYRSSLRYVR